MESHGRGERSRGRRRTEGEDSVLLSADRTPRPAGRADVGETRRTVLAALATVLAVAALSVGLSFTRGRLGDLRCYTLAARRMLDGEEIYRIERGPFTYPPFFAVPFLPLCRLPDFACRAVWYFCNVSLTLAAVWLTLRVAAPVMREPVASGSGGSAAGPPLGAETTLASGGPSDCGHSGKPADGRTAPHRRTVLLPGGVPVPADRRLVVFFVLLATLAGRLVISPIEYQAHDAVVFLLCLLAIVTWDSPRRWLPGFWAGLAAACKATPLLFLPVFLVQRRFRAAAALLLTLAVATLTPDVFFPRRDGQLWAVAWYKTFVSKVEVGAAPDVQSAWDSWDKLNQSLSGTLYRLSTPVLVADEHRFDVSLWTPSRPVLKATTLAAELLVLAVLLWFTWPRRERATQSVAPSERAFQRLGEGGLVLCGMLLLSPMSSKHHFCTLLVPLTFCLVDFLYRRPSVPVAALCVVLFGLGTLGAKDVVGRPLANLLLAYGALTWCTVACFAASCWVLTQRRRLFAEAAGRFRGTDASVDQAVAQVERQKARTTERPLRRAG